MKKVIVLFLMLCFGTVFVACGNGTNQSQDENVSITDEESDGGEASNTSQSNDSLQVVATIYPEYEWVREIAGDDADNIDLTLLLDTGVDLHSYQPTAEDILKISTCDLFIYVGGESDDWVEDALKEGENDNRIVLNMMDVLGDAVKEEEMVEGMQEEDEDEGDEEEPELDEHVWLSLKNAQKLCEEIAEALDELDPDGAKNYDANLKAYEEKLSTLDSEYEQAVSESERQVFLFGDRFPFRYLADDYGISYYAAFAGCSAETEASFETVQFLAEKVDELELPYIMTIEGTDHSIAETIRDTTENKDQKILSFDSMQSSTSATVEEGITYLDIMEKNLEILKQALGKKVS